MWLFSVPVRKSGLRIALTFVVGIAAAACSDNPVALPVPETPDIWAGPSPRREIQLRE